MVTTGKIAQAAERLHEARPEATIILFGSRARGDADEKSDTDFLVVLSSKPRSLRKEMLELANVIRPFRLFADVLVVSRPRFLESSRVPGTLYHSALTEGKLVYGGL